MPSALSHSVLAVRVVHVSRDAETVRSATVTDAGTAGRMLPALAVRLHNWAFIPLAQSLARALVDSKRRRYSQLEAAPARVRQGTSFAL
jgi:hypothetical protein